MTSTQIEIAKRVGCSHATVSRALAGSPLISAATREKVRRVADELGYQRNAVVSNLMALLRTGRDRKYQSTIAYLTSFPRDTITGVGPNYEQYYLGAKKRAETLGYHLDTIWRSQPGLTRARCHEILRSRGIRSFIVAPRERPLGHLNMPWSEYAGVALGHSMPNPHLDVAVGDTFHNVSLALRMARRLGYRRIGLLLTPHQHGHFPAAAAAVTLHMEVSTRADRVPPFLKFSDSNPASDHAAQSWMKRFRPDVIFCAGYGADALLAETGLRVPNDVALADISMPSPTTNRAGIFERTADIGASAVDLVIQRLHNSEFGP
ncbi:MAG: LacI family DNA-binding transcriptional regulator, partial [Terrimicrobiaceae bacterium]